MKIDTHALEDRQVQLTVEVPPDRLQAAMRSAARKLSQQTRIPGFRPGKAPFQMVVNKLGQDVVFEEALDSLGQEVYRQALDQSELEPYAPGSLDEVVSQDPLVLRYTVPLPPEIDLGDYTELRVPFEESEVTEADLESALEELRQNRALIEPADRPAQMEDVVTLDLYAELLEPGEDENPLVLDRKGMEFVLTDDSDWPFPGFAVQVIGMSVDDERSVEHTFAEDYPVERLRARAARFDLKCLEVKSRLVPEWTDDLARGMGEFEDLLDLRLKLRENLEENAQQQAEGAYLELVIQTLLERAEIMYPPVLLEAELDELVAEFSRRLAGQNLTLEDYMQIEKTDLETVRSELEPQAKERLARALALGKIVDLEEFDVDENEISAELDRMVAPFEDQGAELRKAFDHPEGRRRIRLDLLTNKAIKHLVAIAKGEGGIKPAPQAETTMTSEGEPAAAEPDEPVVGAPDEISEAEAETSEE